MSPTVQPAAGTFRLGVTGVLLLVTSTLLAVQGRRLDWQPDQIGGAVLVPLAAGLLMLLLGSLVPQLYGSQGMRWPLVISLPVVHASLMVLVLALRTTSTTALNLPPERALVALSWFHPLNLATSALLQMVVLSLWAVRATQLRGAKKGDPGTR